MTEDITIMPIQPPTQTIDDVVPMAIQPPSSTAVGDGIVVDIKADKGGRNETEAVSTTDQPSTAQLQSNNTTCTATKIYMICISIVLIVTVIILGVVLGTAESSNDDNVNDSNVGGVDTDVLSSAEDTMISSDTTQMEGDIQEVEIVLQNDDDNNDCSLTDLSGDSTTFGQNLGSTIDQKNGGGVCYRVTFGTYGTFDHGYDTVDTSCTDYKPRLTIGNYYRSEGGGILSYYTGGSDLYACESYGGRSGIVKLIFDESISQVVVIAGEVSSCRYEMIITTPNCEVLRDHLKSTTDSLQDIVGAESMINNTSNNLQPTLEGEDLCAVSKAEVLDTLNILADEYTSLPQYEYADEKYMYTVAFFRDSVGVLSGEFKQYESSLWSERLGSFNGEDSIVGNQVFFSGGDIDRCSKPRQAIVTFLCQCGGEVEEVEDHANVLAVERSAELPWSSVVVTEPEGCVYEMKITSKCQSKTPFGDSNGNTGEVDEEEVDEVSS